MRCVCCVISYAICYCQAITNLLYGKVLTSYCTVRCLSQCKINSESAVTYQIHSTHSLLSFVEALGGK